MEGVKLDVFRPAEYKQFVPENAVNESSSNATNVLVIGGIMLVIGLIVLAAVEESRNRDKESFR